MTVRIVGINDPGFRGIDKWFPFKMDIDDLAPSIFDALEHYQFRNRKSIASERYDPNDGEVFESLMIRDHSGSIGITHVSGTEWYYNPYSVQTTS